MKNLLFTLVLFVIQPFAWGQCSNFSISADKSSVCAPDIVRFHVNNSVAGASYVWDVGNGSVAGSDTLYAFYNSADTIDASVQITLPGGTVCTLSVNDILIVHEKPVPDFTASELKLCHGPARVLFEDVTPNSASRNWVIDGSNYNQTADTVSHFFVTTGWKDISIVVVDSFGCEGVGQFLDTLVVYPELDFDFGIDVDSGCAPKTVNFTLTQDPNTAFVKSYNWSFPGATLSSDTSQSPSSRVYSQSGSFDVTLTVTLSNGCTYVTNKPAAVKLGDSLNLRLRNNNPRQCENQPFVVKLINNPIPGDLKWDFSGIPVNVQAPYDSLRAFYYSTDGTLNVTATHNHNGCISTQSISRNLVSLSVEALFNSTDNYHCDLPHMVHLNNLSNKQDADSIWYTWNIYNGGDSLIHTSNQEHDSLTFNTLPAYYDVELIVTGDNGCMDTFRLDNYIYQDSINIKFTPQPRIGCIGQEILYNNTTLPSSYLASDEFKWTFYDKDDSTVLDTSIERSPLMIYYDTGYYSVMVTAENAVPCFDTLIALDVVQIVSPELAYTVKDTLVCLGEDFELIGESTPTNVPFTHRWTFIHRATDSSYTYTGDSIRVSPPLIGVYDLVYAFSIQDGCYHDDTMTVYVNGVDGVIILDSLQDCVPFVLEPSYQVLLNDHLGSPDSSLLYTWSINPNAQVLEEALDSSHPRFTLYEDGDYLINLTVENSTACTNTARLSGIQAGVNASFKIKDRKICLGDSLMVTFTGADPNLSLEWSVLNTTNYGVDDLGNQQAMIAIGDSGRFQVQLVVSKDDRCFDTATSNVTVIQTIANFSSFDTFLQCAPVYVQFQSHSIHADSLYWDFGDGTGNITTSTSAGTIYQKNTGLEDGYDIRLIAVNRQGCYDTAIKEDYIVVKGPRPFFRMEPFVGCEPLEVQFIDSSFDVIRHYMNYNDGSNLDSTTLGTHIYYNNTQQLSTAIFPSLFVYDSLGCGAIYEPPEPIVVYKKPLAGFVLIEDTTACTPYPVVFTDTASYALQTEWQLNGQTISTQTVDSFVITDAGLNQLRLITTNLYNCIDTADESIFVSGLPDLGLIYLDTICLFKTIAFEAIVTPDSNSDTTGMSLRWDFGEPGTLGNDRMGSTQEFFTYQLDGIKQVQIEVLLANNCSDSFELEIDVRGPDRIDRPEINYISFTDNYILDLQHESSNDFRFDRYVYQRSDGWSTYNLLQLDTLLSWDLGTKPTGALCYAIHIEDICELPGFNSTPHCFIYLDVSSVQPYENLLNWTAYSGWPSVQAYRIYKKAEMDTVYQLLDQVAGDVLTYTDTGLCDQVYSYFVQALHPTESYRSNSFKVDQRPIYLYNPLPSHIRNVTVEAHNELQVTWDPSTFPLFDHYTLTKYLDNESQLLNTIDLNATSYTDQEVLTSQHSYVYTLQEVDRCGYIAQQGREGKSILLSGYYDQGAHLNWTPYRQWLNGVETYTVELHYNGVQPLGSVNGAQTTYLDETYHDDVFGAYCYRVYGVNTSEDTSRSNIVCVFGEPIVHIPNAFTPNGDGHNESFRPVTTFVLDGTVEGLSHYYFAIYSRWGERLFETNDIKTAWDGTYLDADCQQGVYLYQLRCLGVDGKEYSYTGTVSLLR